MTQATNRESLSLGSFLFVACTAPSTMRIYAWPSFPLSTSTKIRINSCSAYGWKTQYQQNYIHPILHREPQNYEACEAANTEVCWIYLNYWSCWRHLGRETVVTQNLAKWQVSIMLSIAKYQGTFSDNQPGSQLCNSWKWGENGVLPLLYDRITMNVECQKVRVAIWVWKIFYNTEDFYQNLAMNTVGAGLVGFPTLTCSIHAGWNTE